MQVLEEARTIECPRANVTGGCKPPDVGVGSQKGPLEDSACPALLLHSSRTSFIAQLLPLP